MSLLSKMEKSFARKYFEVIFLRIGISTSNEVSQLATPCPCFKKSVHHILKGFGAHIKGIQYYLVADSVHEIGPQLR